MNLLYGDQPAGWNIADTRENVRNTKREDFVNYKKTQYIPKRTTVIVSGKLKEREVLSVVRNVFGEVKNTKHLAMPRVVEQQKRPEVLVSYKKTDQTHIVLGVRTFDIFDKRNPILTVLSTMLAGGMSSRLFIKLREELGVAYYVRAYNDTYTDHGFLEVSAGVSNDRVKEVVTEILKECKKLCDTPASKQELDKVKEYLVGNMKLELESSSDFATFYGSQEVMNLKIKKPEDVERLIRKVTTRDVQKMAKTIFTNRGLNLALIGPFEDKKEFEKILKF
jgi:predicted Zn-dependent peptidase